MASGKGFFRRAIEDFLQTFAWGEWVADKFEVFTVKIEDWVFGWYGNLYARLREVPYFGEYFPDPSQRGRRKTVAWLVPLLGVLSAVIYIAVDAVNAPYKALVTYWSSRKAKQARLTPEQAIALMWVLSRNAPQAVEDLRDLGYSDERIEHLYQLSRNLLPVGDVVRAWQRGIITEAELDQTLRKQHYDAESIHAIKMLGWYIPPPQDLVSMAVRDVWNEQIVTKYGYDEDYPEQFAEWTKKAGMSPDWALRYWRAHWNLPSPQMGYEMLHRLREGRTDTPFTEQDLDNLLKIADYPKWFRTRMMKISYTPYTRVDIRRMYVSGILSKEDVYHAYRDIGYNDEHARRLTEFTVKQDTGTEKTKAEEYKELSISLVKQSYMRRLIDRPEAERRLSALKYEQDEIAVILRLWDYELSLKSKPSYQDEYISDIKSIVEKAYLSDLITQNEYKDYLRKIGYGDTDIGLMTQVIEYAKGLSNLQDLIEIIHDLYMNGVITYDEAVVRLSKTNLPASMQDNLVNKWVVEAEKRTRHLTEVQYRACYGAGLITAEEYRHALKLMGYTDKDIELLCQLYEIA